MQRVKSKFKKNFLHMLKAIIGTILAVPVLRLITGENSAGFIVMMLIVLLNIRKMSSLVWLIGTALSCSIIASLLVVLMPTQAGRESIITLIIAISCTCGVAFVVHALLRKINEQHKYSYERLSTTELVNQINNRLLTERGMDALQQLTLSCIYEVSGNSSVIFTMQNNALTIRYKYPPGLLLYPTEIEAAQLAWKKRIPVGYGTLLCNFTSFRYIPLISGNKVLAVVGILFDTEKKPDKELINMLDQIMVKSAVAMERQMLADEQQQIMMENEAERIRSNFLRAISHDLRTPLTGIIGACSALTNDNVQLDEVSRKNLINDVSEEASWLLRMVENLLSVTRVGTDGPKLRKTLEPVEEIVTEAVSKSQKRFPDVTFHVDLPEDFIMIPMDPTLIVQVLMNLIENAVKYSYNRKQIDISVTDGYDFVTFTVRDYGKGLSKKELDCLFEPSATKNGDFSHGLGLGLSICRSIISAHGGEISGRNDETIGAIFTFTLPKEDSNEKQGNHSSCRR